MENNIIYYDIEGVEIVERVEDRIGRIFEYILSIDWNIWKIEERKWERIGEKYEDKEGR